MIDEQISSIFLRVGKYLNEHCCQYCCIRFWIVIFAFISFIYEVVYGLAFYNKHNDYHIYNEHYLIRVDNNHIQSYHIQSHCQYFRSLNSLDLSAINGYDTIFFIISIILSLFGATIVSMWATFLEMRGRFGSYATSTISNLLLCHFSLMRSVVIYGDQCIQYSNLEWLLVGPQFYPFLGIFVFIIGVILLAVYFKVNLYQIKWAYYGWILLLIFELMIWTLCMFVTIKNTPLGVFVSLGIIFDLLCVAQAYYDYVMRRDYGEPEEEGCCSSLGYCCQFKCC